MDSIDGHKHVCKKCCSLQHSNRGKGYKENNKVKDLDLNEIRKCYGCKILKTLENYHKNFTNKNGFDTYCKSCRNILIHKYNKTLQGKYKSSKNDAKNRTIDFFLSKEQFELIVDDHCHYCRRKRT